jgi:hypothetical protein
MDWRHMAEMLAAGDSAKFELLNLCIWVKTNGGMGSLYRSRHELVFVFRNGGEAHRNNVQLGRFGRNRTNVWNYPGANVFKRNGRKTDLDLHPTVKPIAMVADAILAVGVLNFRRNKSRRDPASSGQRNRCTCHRGEYAETDTLADRNNKPRDRACAKRRGTYTKYR